MKRNEIIHEHKKGVRAVKYNAKPKTHIEPPKPTNPVAKNASAAIGGGAAGAHKDAKKASQSVRGQKHKAAPEMAEGYNPNSASAEHRRSLDDHTRQTLKAKAEAPDATDRDKERYQNYLDRKEQMRRAYDDRMERESIEQEGYYRQRGSSSAYDRDYRSSVSGMGKRDSLAYQLDGGANDEGWDEEPRQRRQEPAADAPHDVYIDGRKWKTFDSASHARNVARKLQEKGKNATVKAASTDEATGDALGTISATTPDGKVSIKTATGDEIKTDQSALMPGANGTVQMKPDAAGDALKPGAKVVSTENSVLNELDPPPNDSTSPIHGGRANSDHGEHNEIISLLRRMLSRR